MTRYFESAAARNQEDAVARVLESGATAGGITETWTGSDGVAWPAQWTITRPTGGTITNTIQGNRGQLTAGAAGYTLALAQLNGSTHTDIDVTFLYSALSVTERYIETFYRMGALSGGFPASCYCLDISVVANQVNLQTIDAAGSGVPIATVDSAGVNIATDLNIRILVVGNNHKVKWWSGTEPGTWQINVNDATFTSGPFALGLYSSAGSGTVGVQYDNLSLTVPPPAAAVTAKGVGVNYATGSPSTVLTDLTTIDASWWYNWASYSVPGIGGIPATPGIEYVPQMWGDWILDDRYGVGALGGDPASSIGPSNILLGFNEPNIPAQANMTAARALALWPQLEATGALLGSPVVSPNASSDIPWLDTFMAGSPRVDFLCVHWYPEWNGGFANIGDYLDFMHTRYGLPLWLTEVCTTDGTVAENAALIPTVMAAVATRPWVERTAWFVMTRDPTGGGYPGSVLTNPDGSLNAAGTVYETYPPGSSVMVGPELLNGTAAGISTTTGTLSVARALAGTAGGLSTTTGAIIRSVSLAGSVSGLSSTTTGALIAARTLVGTAGGLSTTTGALAVGRALVGTSTGLSTDTAAMIVARTLAGTSTGQSTVTGDLAGSSAATLTGNADGLSTTTGALSVTRGLAGSAGGLSTAGATGLIAQRALVGTAAGLSTTTAALARAVPLAGTAAGLSTTSGTLASAGLPGGMSSAESTATGALVVARALVGTATGASTTTGALARAVPLAGTADGTSTTTGALTVARALVGSATGVSTAGGTSVTVARALVGSATGISTTTGNLLATAAGGISGLTSGLSTATGALSVAKALAGTSGGLSGSTGAIAKQIPLASVSAVGLSSAVASIARGVPLSGTAGGVSATTAATAVARSLVGSSGGLSTASAPRLSANQALAGSANGVGGASASLTVNPGLKGSASGTSNASGTLQTIRIALVYGLWNGQAFEAMQYGDKQVVDFLMIPT